jgi:hypothetical protein
MGCGKKCLTSAAINCIVCRRPQPPVPIPLQGQWWEMRQESRCFESTPLVSNSLQKKNLQKCCVCTKHVDNFLVIIPYPAQYGDYTALHCVRCFSNLGDLKHTGGLCRFCTHAIAFYIRDLYKGPATDFGIHRDLGSILYGCQGMTAFVFLWPGYTDDQVVQWTHTYSEIPVSSQERQSAICSNGNELEDVVLSEISPSLSPFLSSLLNRSYMSLRPSPILCF